MENVRVCRICLITGVKMYNLHSYPLNSYFEAIFGNNPPSMTELPPYGCYQCTALVVKLYRFRERCLAGQAVLCSILQSEGKITTEALNRIDRNRLKLTSNLCVEQNRKMYCLVQNNKDPFEVKVELPKQERDNEYNEDYIAQYEFIKEEHSYCDDVENHDEFSVAAISSDDGEVLLLHKNVEEQTENTGKMKTEEEASLDSNDELQAIESVSVELLDEESETEDKHSQPQKTVAKKSQVKQRGSMKQTGGVDNDDINLKDCVTVSKLTTEEQLEEFKKRQQSSNYVNAAFKCNLCFKGFISKETFKHHVARHDPSAGKLECPICKYRFRSKRRLQNHSAMHRDKFACKFCPNVSTRVEQAKTHQRWHNGFTYKCQYCGEVFAKWTTKLSHVRLKHSSEFICDLCGCSYVSKMGLAMHKAKMHKDFIQKTEPEGESVKPGPSCQECDVQFLSVEAWNRHMVTSAKHKPANDCTNICRDCGSEFARKEELRRHRRDEHARLYRQPKELNNCGEKYATDVWPATCQHCPEEIRNGREYWAHFRRAHPDKPYPSQKNYVCDICGKSFVNPGHLVYHKRTHTGEKPYKCAQCPKSFHNPNGLHLHVTVHSDERPHPCTLCSKTFKRKGALVKHFTCHTDEKRFKCKVCDKAYRLQDSMRLHLKTVHLNQPPPIRKRKRRPGQTKPKQTKLDQTRPD